VPVLSLLAGLGFGVAFIHRQRTLTDPLLDLKLLRDRTIGVSLTGTFCYSMLGGGVMLMMLLYFQLVAGMSALAAGAAMVPGMIAGAIGFQVAPRLAARFRPSVVIAIGLLGAAAGFAAMTRFDPTSGSATLVIGFAVTAFFGAPMPVLGTNLVVASAPPEQAGTAGALAQMGNELGSTLGLAIYGTIGAAVYRATLDLPTGTPPDVATAAADSLAGVTAAAATLPDDTAAAVLGPAQAAFASGVQAVVAIGAVMLTALSVMVAIRLRHVPPFGQTETPPTA
jgi:DHA2 family multidrug resistance protein-like MFS transporter